MNARVVQLTFGGDARPIGKLADGSDLSGDLIVGADGVHSVLRAALHPDATPQPTAFSAWRGVIHGDAPARLAALDGLQWLGPKTECGAARAGRDAVYWYVGIRRNKETTAEHPSADQCKRAVLAHVAKFDPLLRGLIEDTAADQIRYDDLYETAELPDWGNASATLLGDAAHTMLPHAGQGAAQALEDAIALARHLDGVAADPAAVAQGVRAYQAHRRQRVKRIAKLARRNAHVGSLAAGPLCWMRDLAIRRIPTRLLARELVAIGFGDLPAQ